MNRRSAGFAPGAFAGMTGHMFADFDSLFGSERGPFEGDGDIGAQIRAAALSPATAEKIAEYVAEGGKDVFKTAEPAKPLSLQSVVSELIVDPPLFRITQDFISLGGYLETFLGVFVAGIFIRMVFESQLAVGFFQFGLRSVSVDSQNLIKVSLHPGSLRFEFGHFDFGGLE
jgi:hypothetical protein